MCHPTNVDAMYVLHLSHAVLSITYAIPIGEEIGVSRAEVEACKTRGGLQFGSNVLYACAGPVRLCLSIGGMRYCCHELIKDAAIMFRTAYKGIARLI